MPPGGGGGGKEACGPRLHRTPDEPTRNRKLTIPATVNSFVARLTIRAGSPGEGYLKCAIPQTA